jgi:phospholipid/cholesterol/gamma-HCH transport system substrate-binding protein
MPKKKAMGYGVVLFTALGFLVIGFLSIQLHGYGIRASRTSRLYTVTAVFENAGGLKVGAPVKLAGIRVGEVRAISLDASREFKAVVVLALQSRFGTIPVDSVAVIQTASLLGGNFIAISPGAGAPLVDHGEIQTSNSPFSLERLIAPLTCGNHPGDCAPTNSH